MRKIEAVRDRVTHGCGTEEPWVRDDYHGIVYSVQWRKPLRLDEVNQLAPTPEVLERKGRG